MRPNILCVIVWTEIDRVRLVFRMLSFIHELFRDRVWNENSCNGAEFLDSRWLARRTYTLRRG